MPWIDFFGLFLAGACLAVNTGYWLRAAVGGAAVVAPAPTASFLYAVAGALSGATLAWVCLVNRKRRLAGKPWLPWLCVFATVVSAYVLAAQGWLLGAAVAGAPPWQLALCAFLGLSCCVYVNCLRLGPAE